MRVTDDVMLILANARVDGARLYLPEQLERKTYTLVNEVLEAAGGKWKRGEKAHVFEGGAAEAVDQLLLTGQVATAQEFGFFETPDFVAELAVEEADVRPDHVVLEPSAGRGQLVRAVLKQGAKRVDCHELQDRHASYLRVAFGGQPVTVAQGDFLAVKPARIYDRVVMNPPFARRADILHVRHALQFLKPGGALAAIASAGVRFRQDQLAQNFREVIDMSGGYIEDLPDGCFRESGTNVRAVLVVIQNVGAGD